MRFHSVGAQDGRKMLPPPHKKRREETQPLTQPPTPPEVIEMAEVEETTKNTPTHSSHESYLMKFAKKLFGPRTPKHGSESETVVGNKAQERIRKQSKGATKSPSASPRKSPKKKRRKSKPQQGQQDVDKNRPSPDSVALQPTQTSQLVPREKQPHHLNQKQQQTREKSPGVSQLAKLYESGSSSSRASERPAEKSTLAGKEGAELVVPKVSVASVIKKLEQHKKEGMDMADYEKELEGLMCEGAEEVDAGILEAIDKFVEEKGEGKESERESQRTRPESSEILDDEVPIAEGMVGKETMENVHEGATESVREGGTESNATLPKKKEGTSPIEQVESVQKVTGQEVDTPPADKEQGTATDSSSTGTSSHGDGKPLPPSYKQQSSLVEERKMKMGLPTETKTYAKTIQNVDSTAIAAEERKEEKKPIVVQERKV